MRKRFRNLKVGRKLAVAFISIIILYIVTVATAVLNIRNMSEKIESLYYGPFANVESSLKIIADMQVINRNILIMATTDGVDSNNANLEKTRELIEQNQKELENLASGYVSGQDKVDALVQQMNELTPVRAAVMELLEEGKDEEAYQNYLSVYNPKVETVKETLSEVVELSLADAQDKLVGSQNSSVNTIIIFLILAVACIIMTIILCIAICKSITEPVKEVQKAANEIASGQLNINIGYTARDELGELSENIRNTAQTLNSYVAEIRRGLEALGKGELKYHTEVEFAGDFEKVREGMEEIAALLSDSMQQIGGSAEQVAGGAEQVSNNAQALARGASEQAGSIEELAASINEISDGVKNNADVAVKSSMLANKVGESLVENNRQMQELLGSINQIKQNSREITKIVSEIEDIAFQTNILALNASVGAARAGEAGRGFSVVAGEVRRLAAKTAEASKLTSELIVRNADAVEAGQKVVDAAVSKMQESVEGAQEVKRKVEVISEASTQQSDAIIQIRKSVELISEIVQGNSAMSQESAAASEELSAQAQILKELVERFEI